MKRNEATGKRNRQKGITHVSGQLHMGKSVVISLIFLLLATIACGEKEDTGKLNVVVSIVPLQEFVEKVGGEKVNVMVMVPPGASPHVYEPTPSQLRAVSAADMYVKVGTPVEFEVQWLEKLLAMNRTMHVCDASGGIETITVLHDREHMHKTPIDPHVWLSPRNARIMVENICAGFVSIDSRHADYYETNRDAYVVRLDSLDRTVIAMLDGKQNRQFLVYHPAWHYFAEAYGLEQVSVEAAGKEPTALSMQHIIENARVHDINVVFVSPQFNTKSAEVIAREIGGRVVYIDPLNKDYVANIETVAKALGESME